MPFTPTNLAPMFTVRLYDLRRQQWGCQPGCTCDNDDRHIGKPQPISPVPRGVRALGRTTGRPISCSPEDAERAAMYGSCASVFCGTSDEDSVRDGLV